MSKITKKNRPYGICYLCGIEAEQTPEKKLTKDHVPPECFAPEPLPEFTATSTSRFQYAWACRACNKYWSTLENEFKNMMLTGAKGNIQAAEDAWESVLRENKTSIEKYNKPSKSVRNLLENLYHIYYLSDNGLYLPGGMARTVPKMAEELHVAIKIARGLHVVHTGEIVPETYEIDVAFNEYVTWPDGLTPIYSRLDTNFFRYYGYSYANENPYWGLWYMRFFKGQTAMVWFRPKKV